MPPLNTTVPESGLGFPLQIIDLRQVPKRDSRFVLKDKELKSILKQAADRPIYLISIAGASRQGKSFLLSIILNVLQQYEKGNFTNAWDEMLRINKLDGFEFQNGMDRKTVGFWMWSKPFILQRADGSEIAIVIMDTQGVFDQFTTVREWSMIVGLSLLTSSCTIYNVTQNIQEDTLSVFNSFVEFGMLSLQEDENLNYPFEKLLFLIRDWNMPQALPYGSNGGKEFLRRRLAVDNDMAEELKKVRQTINTCFEEVDCCLLPHPGEPVKFNDYKGELKILETEFIQEIKSFTDDLLCMDDKKGKTINNQEVRYHELLVYFEKYVEVFNATKLPKPKTLLEVTREAKLSSFIDSEMEKVTEFLNSCGNSDVLVSLTKFKTEFDQMYVSCQQSYNKQSSSVKSEVLVSKYKDMLCNGLIGLYTRAEQKFLEQRTTFKNSCLQKTIEDYKCLLAREIGTVPLFKAQFDQLVAESKSQVQHQLVQICGPQDEEFFTDLADAFNKQTNEITQVLKAQNDEKLSVEEKKYEEICSSLFEDYKNLMEVSKSGMRGHFTMQQLEDVHRRSQEAVLRKVHSQLKSSNELLQAKMIETLTESISSYVQLLAMECEENSNRLDQESEALVLQVTNEFRIKFGQTIANTPKVDLKREHQFQKSIQLMQLQSLHTNNPEGAKHFISKAESIMDQYLMTTEEQVQYRRQEDEVHLEETVQNVTSNFVASLGKEMSIPEFHFEKNFKPICTKLLKVALNIKQHMSWTEDEELRSKFKSKIDAFVKQELKKRREEHEFKKENEMLEFENEICRRIDCYNFYLNDLIKTKAVRELDVLTQEHERQLSLHKEEIKALHYPNVAAREKEKQQKDFEFKLKENLQHIIQTMQQSVSQINKENEEYISTFAKNYDTEMNYKCSIVDLDLDKLQTAHFVCAEKVQMDFCNQIKSVRNTDEIRQMLESLSNKMTHLYENRVEQLRKVNEEQEELFLDSAQPLYDEFERQIMQLIRQKHQPAHATIHKLMKDKVKTFESIFKIPSHDQRRLKKQNFKENLKKILQSCDIHADNFVSSDVSDFESSPAGPSCSKGYSSPPYPNTRSQRGSAEAYTATPRGTGEKISMNFTDSRENGIIKSSKIIYNNFMAKLTFGGKIPNPKTLASHHEDAVKAVKQSLPSGTANSIISEIEGLLHEEYKLFRERTDSGIQEDDDIAIGIDLGTTNCAVAYYRNDGAIMIPDKTFTKLTTPSYVLYKENEVIIGEVAKNNSVVYPKNTIFDSKRLIGRAFTDEKTQEDIKNWPFEVVSHENRPHIRVNGQNISPETIAKEILVKLKKDAEHHLHRPVKHAVITVPAYFSDAQKTRTKEAGKLAGFNVLAILNEPSAAAIAYSVAYSSDKEKNIIVYDLGGGTFDVSVLSVLQGTITVKSVGGDNHLGGEDFDSKMVNFCLEQFKNKHGIDLMEGNSDITSGRLRRIRQVCENRKADLSSANSVDIIVTGICQNLDLNIQIQRDEFNKMNESLFKRTIDITKKALADSNITASQIDDVILVGGSTRIPKVQELLSNLFPGKRLNMDINQDEVVARGASIYAALKNGSRLAKIKNLKFFDVTPYSIGIEILGDKFSKLIQRNSPVPVSKTETFKTGSDNATSTVFNVYQGEHETASRNILLGKFVVNGIPKAKEGVEKFDLTIECDEEGFLKVTAVIVSTGKEVSVFMKSSTADQESSLDTNADDECELF